VKSTCLMITEELVLQGEPQVARGTTMLPNDLLKIDSDRVGEPAEDYNVHPGPHRIIGEGVIGENVVGEGVPCQGHLANVWYCRCLNVEVGDECRVVGGTVDHVRCSRGRGGRR
jgi:hypothetical protein